MTRQYITGELSLLLGQLQAVATDETAATALAGLRQRVETSPMAGLESIVVRALNVADTVCWTSLAHMDTTTFDIQASIASDLHRLATCSGLLDDP